MCTLLGLERTYMQDLVKTNVKKRQIQSEPFDPYGIELGNRQRDSQYARTKPFEKLGSNTLTER